MIKEGSSSQKQSPDQDELTINEPSTQTPHPRITHDDGEIRSLLLRSFVRIVLPRYAASFIALTPFW